MRTIKTLAAALLAAAWLPAIAQDFEDVESPWVTDATQFSCPAKAKIGDVITIRKSTETWLSELGVSDPDGDFLFLVLGSQEPGMTALMKSKALIGSRSVSLASASLTGFTGDANPKVFRKLGDYTFSLWTFGIRRGRLHLQDEDRCYQLTRVSNRQVTFERAIA